MDQPKRDYILQGVAEGFHITDPSKFTEYQEVRNKRYQIVSQKPKLVSALGAIPKTPGNSAIRIIHDASRPDNTSLNAHAWHNPFSYQRIQDA